MKLKIRILVLLSVVMMSFAPVFAANGCTTERLSTILGHFPAIDLSSLSAKSIFLFDNQGNKITIRTNEWNDTALLSLRAKNSSSFPPSRTTSSFFIRFSLCSGESNESSSR